MDNAQCAYVPHTARHTHFAYKYVITPSLAFPYVLFLTSERSLLACFNKTSETIVEMKHEHDRHHVDEVFQEFKEHERQVIHVLDHTIPKIKITWDNVNLPPHITFGIAHIMFGVV